jgi:phosphatidylserine decarboxylase
MLKIAGEGYPFILFFLALTVLSLFLWFWIAPFFLLLTIFMVYFFRDPERTIPDRDDIFVSPADGRVIRVERVREERYIKRDLLMVSIFMSPFDVHVNRSPCDGRVRSVVYSPGRFLSAFKEEASIQNENITMVLDTRYGDIIVRQVAGFLARRAVCRVKEGDFLKKGQRFGMIKFSSRVDLYLPLNTRVMVRVGEKVRAGETVIGEVIG